MVRRVGEGARRRSERASFLKGRRRRVYIWLWGQEKRGAWWCGDGVRAVLCVYTCACVGKMAVWRMSWWMGSRRGDLKLLWYNNWEVGEWWWDITDLANCVPHNNGWPAQVKEQKKRRASDGCFWGEWRDSY